MEVCDVCGALLVVGDAQPRLAEHLMGKQHVGYARLRATLDKLKEVGNECRALILFFSCSFL